MSAPPVPPPNQLFRLFESGVMSREKFHEAMAFHARETLAEVDKARRNPFAARFEAMLNKRAAKSLIKEHGEPVLREIFHALAEVPDFHPAIHLWNAWHWHVPMHCFLRTRSEPVFRVIHIETQRMTATIAVEYGKARRKYSTREEFTLQRHWDGHMEVIERRKLG